MIGILDYGVGNIGSLRNMFSRICVESVFISDWRELKKADALILPGVGHFNTGMRELRNKGFVEPLQEMVTAGSTPILGICLGMQMLARASEEGSEPGLGFVPATVKRFSFPSENELPVPNMGWHQIFVQRQNPLLKTDEDDFWRFYFAHSYHMVCDDPANVIATARYGSDFTAAVNNGPVWGVQFHPEKSHVFGMKLLTAFAAAAGG